MHPRGAILVALGGGRIACARSQKLLGPRSAPQAHTVQVAAGLHDLLTAAMPSESHPLRSATMPSPQCALQCAAQPGLQRPCTLPVGTLALCCPGCPGWPGNARGLYRVRPSLPRRFWNSWLRADFPQPLPRRVRCHWRSAASCRCEAPTPLESFMQCQKIVCLQKLGTVADTDHDVALQNTTK